MKRDKPSMMWQDSYPPDGPEEFRVQCWRYPKYVYLRIQERRTWRTVASWRTTMERYQQVIGREWFMRLDQYLSRLAETTAASTRKSGPSDPVFAEKYPLVYELMTCSDAGAGKTRELSRVSVWVEPHGFKASITEPGNRISCFVTSDSLEGIFEALEHRLHSDEPDVWRAWAGDWRKSKNGKK